MAADPPPVKDVEAFLLKERPRLRRPGEVIYPLEYNHELVSFDNWNHMFLVSCFRGLTMSAVHPPPSTVLDLGCGGGLWALEAAKQWPNSTVIGFDIKDIQPRLNKYIDPRQENFWQRVTWVHGNLLDGLPFPPDYFDFVRIAGLGLAVPEDEWQYVLEEVARVMKPRGTLEIIEEDLIFPTGPVPKPRPRPPPISVDLPPSLDSIPTTASSRAPSTYSSKDSPPWGISFEEPPSLTLHTKSKPSLAPVHEIVFPLTDVPVSAILPPPLARRLHARSLSSSHREAADADPDAAPHPQDHAKLLAAWDAMLSRRFLSPQLTTVLPFYLSSFFDDVQTHAPLLIRIPPNSCAAGAQGPAQGHGRTPSVFEPGVFALSASAGRRSGEAAVADAAPATTATSAWAPMHLARCVATASACKEAVWDEYKRMYDDDLPPVLNVAGGRAKASSSRETFEADWASWENDMLDRIGSRRLLQREFAWSEPETERPEWRVWRSNLDVKAASASASSAPSQTELCRSMRGFVAVKPGGKAPGAEGKGRGTGSSSNSTKSAGSGRTTSTGVGAGNSTGSSRSGGAVQSAGTSSSAKAGLPSAPAARQASSSTATKPANLSIPAKPPAATSQPKGAGTPDASTPRASNVGSAPRPTHAPSASKAANEAIASASRASTPATTSRAPTPVTASRASTPAGASRSPTPATASHPPTASRTARTAEATRSPVPARPARTPEPAKPARAPTPSRAVSSPALSKVASSSAPSKAAGTSAVSRPAAASNPPKPSPSKPPSTANSARSATISSAQPLVAPNMPKPLAGNGPPRPANASVSQQASSKQETLNIVPSTAPRKPSPIPMASMNSQRAVPTGQSTTSTQPSNPPKAPVTPSKRTSQFNKLTSPQR